MTSILRAIRADQTDMGHKGDISPGDADIAKADVFHLRTFNRGNLDRTIALIGPQDIDPLAGLTWDYVDVLKQNAFKTAT